MTGSDIVSGGESSPSEQYVPGNGYYVGVGAIIGITAAAVSTTLLGVPSRWDLAGFGVLFVLVAIHFHLVNGDVEKIDNETAAVVCYHCDETVPVDPATLTPASSDAVESRGGGYGANPTAVRVYCSDDCRQAGEEEPTQGTLEAWGGGS